MIVRLLMLIAAMVMSPSLLGVPAMAHSGHGFDQAAQCSDDPARGEVPPPGNADCAVMCTMLVTQAAMPPPPGPAPRSCRYIAKTKTFAGITLDIATPPPRPA